MLKILTVISIFLIMNFSCAMEKTVIDGIKGKNILHIVTLSRTPCSIANADIADKNDPVLVKYPLITALEAVTVFSIVNYFLGKDSDFDSILLKAENFDQKAIQKLHQLKKELSTIPIKNKKRIVSQSLQQDLSIIFKDCEGSFIKKLADNITEYLYTENTQQETFQKSIISLELYPTLFVQVEENTYRLKLKKDGIKLLRNEKLKLDLGKLKTCLLEPEKMECIGKENIDKLIDCSNKNNKEYKRYSVSCSN